MVEELQQQMFYIGRKIPEKQLNLGSAKSKASYRLDYGWSYGEKMIYRNSELDRKKMELEKLTFTHGAYRDKKAVLYFSSGREAEVNIHNLNCRMLHEARSIDLEPLRCVGLTRAQSPQEHWLNPAALTQVSRLNSKSKSSLPVNDDLVLLYLILVQQQSL
uniref:Uncharacterized protein n=1 Tax=Brassica campestris TaxID=3711 RepID=M4DTQ2_BRACM